MSTTIEHSVTPPIAPMPAVDTLPDAQPMSSLYRVVWRWHFYAGLFTVPFLLMLALTGTIIMFQNELNDLVYRHQHVVTPGERMLPYDEQLARVQQAYPEMSVVLVQPSWAADRSTMVMLTDDAGADVSAFVDPYTGALLGDRDNTRTLTGVANTMHGTFLLGDWGDRMIEIAAGWAIVLTVSGLYLWWPRKGSKVWGVLLPRLGTTNPRVWWRDLHAVPAVWTSGLLLLTLISGMTWTGFWGEMTQVWSTFPAAMWDEVPESTALTRSLNTPSTQVSPWATEAQPLPESEHAGHSTGGAEGVRAGQIGLDQVITIARRESAPQRFNISLPADERGVYTVSASSAGAELDDATQERLVHIDQYSGAVLANIGWNEYSGVAKAVAMSIAIHEGKQFGLINRIATLLLIATIIGSTITGVVMWWRRRPTGRIGAPTMPKSVRLWKGAVAIMLVLGVVFPLVGASLLTVLLLDFLIIRRVPVLKRVIG
ncbi:MAG TPA: PepSY domain-containing protein [Herpetosiphonaceae bacterium]